MNHSRPNKVARGFTLLELMTSLTVTAIVMTAIMGSLLASHRHVVNSADVSGIQANVRTAAMQITKALDRAGYAIDPHFALEPCPMADRRTDDSYSSRMRDSSGPYGSDELVVQYADPNFGRRVTGIAGLSLVLDSNPAEVPVEGTRFLLICPSATNFAYVTASTGSSGATVMLKSIPPAPFNEEYKLAADECFKSAYVFRVERRHYFIGWLPDPGQIQPRPALLLRRGIDLDGDGAVDKPPSPWPGSVNNPITALNDAEVVAMDIEQLQIAYVLNQPLSAGAYGLNTGPDSNGDFVYGNDPGVPEVPPRLGVWNGDTAYAPTQFFPAFLDYTPPASPALTPCSKATDTNDDCGYGKPRRFLGHPANVRAVRFSLAARSPKEDFSLVASTLDLNGQPLENLTAGQLPPPTHHYRVSLQESVSLRNVFQLQHFVFGQTVANGGI